MNAPAKAAPMREEKCTYCKGYGYVIMAPSTTSMGGKEPCPNCTGVKAQIVSPAAPPLTPEQRAEGVAKWCSSTALPLAHPAAPQGDAEPVPKLKGWYPDYVSDADGLERFRRAVQCNDGHDMAAVNHNSLGRLIDTIERLRFERDAARAALAALAPAAIASGREGAE
jgi:hypothetical protein